MPVDFRPELTVNIDVPKSAEVMSEMQKAMRRAVDAVLKRARANLSGRFVRIRSGKGLRSLRTSVGTQGADRVIGLVGSPVFYLRMLHTGYPAQTMTVKRPGRKFFTYVAGGHLHTSRTIKHPGIRPRPWLRAAADESKADIFKAFSEAVKNLGARIAGGRAAA